MEDGDNGDENETTRVEYQSFESLDEAISYAFPHQQQQQSSKQQKKDNNNKEAAATVKTLKKELQKSNTREANLQKEIEKMKDSAKQEQERFSSCFEKAAAKAKDRSQKELKREQNAHIKVLEQLKTRHQKALEREQKRSLKAIEKQTKKLKGIIQRQAKKKRSLLELEEEEGNGDETDASNTPLKRPRVEKTSDNRDNQRHLKWKMRYEQLVAYKEQYGDCNVSLREQKKNLNEGNNNNNPESAELKALGVWITTQRTAYTRLKRGEPSSMTRERIELLENIGFIWNAGPGQLPFEKRVEQLIEYRNIHGHCNVPQKHGQLGEFVMHTRKRYREQRMSAEKIAILEEVGFQWSLRNRGGPLELRMAKAAAHAEPFVPDHHDW